MGRSIDRKVAGQRNRVRHMNRSVDIKKIVLQVHI